eukprot:TRINITY_DN12015_c0_g1_i1.p1 TRINITY_DN12015_c0_g1~~TRINITY_DN12015_c0_g1_i1.p1  ORF type:complete len:345 (+),score=60.21 TRINITY_DN12015_c0_g1_i1:156-1190(+)
MYRKEATPRFLQLGLLVLVMFSVSCSFIYLVSSLRSLSDDIRSVRDSLQPVTNAPSKRVAPQTVVAAAATPPDSGRLELIQSELAELKLAMADTQKRLNRSERRIVKLYNAVDPWERCLRIHYRTNCEGGEGIGGPKPPCSVDILKEMIFFLTEALEQAKITHWVSYGTLLGSVRNQSIIPWTSDVDIVVPGAEYGQMQAKLASVGLLEKMGYLFFYDRKYPDIGRMCITDDAERYLKYAKGDVVEKADYFNAYPYADIYQTSVREKAGVVSVRYGPGCKWHEKTIFPLTRVTLYGREMYAPGNYTQYLSQLYGPDWRIPPKGLRSGHGLYSDACKKEWQLGLV